MLHMHSFNTDNWASASTPKPQEILKLGPTVDFDEPGITKYSLALSPMLLMSMIGFTTIQAAHVMQSGKISFLSCTNNFSNFFIVVSGILNAIFSRKPHEKLVSSRDTNSWRSKTLEAPPK